MHRTGFTFCAFLLPALALSAPGEGQSIEIFLDLDADAVTGCTVSTVDGDVDGVEEILRTDVGQQGVAPGDFFVGELTRRECADPATDTLGPEVPVDPGGWLAMSGTGVDSTRAVELYWPLPVGSGAPSSKADEESEDLGSSWRCEGRSGPGVSRTELAHHLESCRFVFFFPSHLDSRSD